MIQERSVLQLNGSEGTAEFNVDPGNEYFHLTVGKEKRIFKRADLWALTFAISGAEEQDKMMPVQKMEMLTYKRIHRIKVKKHLKPGDIITCQCEINVEKEVARGLKGMIDQEKSNKLITGTSLPLIG